VDEPDRGLATAARLDQVLERHQGPLGALGTLVREPLAGLPGGDGGLHHETADVGPDRASLAGLDLAAPHEPGVDHRAARDRLPDLVGARVDGDLGLDLERMGHLRAPSFLMWGWTSNARAISGQEMPASAIARIRASRFSRSVRTPAAIIAWRTAS
jgi:hypothetical protein